MPQEFALAAWEHHRQVASERGSAFFRFIWNGATWLAFGLEDGSVRGVYCPEHAAERDQRTALDGESPSCAAQPASAQVV